jgi:NAD(P)-dependent dehydrogenase (short-subunit alcohol dehydrogenase family)
MDGATAMVTGAGGGLGLAAAIGFARLGARVLAVGRSEARAAEAAASVAGAVPGAAVTPGVCDLSSLASVRAFADRLGAEEDRLDVVVHNAGVMPPERTLSTDGVELMFATHVLAPFVLTERLGDLLRSSAPSRVIIVASGGMYAHSLDGQDLQAEREDYAPAKLYARTKRAQVVLAELLADELAADHVVVHAMHPGWADTEGVRGSMPAFRRLTRPILRTPEEGADTVVWLGAAPEPARCTGVFWHDRRPRPTRYAIGPGDEDPAERRALWAALRKLAATG